MYTVITILSWVFVISGSGFIVAGALGLIRMPDLCTRIHAASVSETLVAVLLVIGLMLQAGLSLVTLKLLFVLALFFFTGPVAAHALAQAALHQGVEPLLDDDRRTRHDRDDAQSETSGKES